MKLRCDIFLFILVVFLAVASLNIYISICLPIHYLFSYNTDKFITKQLTIEDEDIINYIPKNKCYKNEDIFCIKEREYHNIYPQKNRTGLSMIKKLYDYLPGINARYSSMVPLLYSITENLVKSSKVINMKISPWKLALNWVSSNSLIGKNISGIGDILAAMNSYNITFADNEYKGTQLKLALTLEKKQKVIFKPKRYGRYQTKVGAVYDGADRHYGEIAAFHLSRLLNLTMVPLTVGRRVSLTNDILPVATSSLSNTFFNRGRSSCFYGRCYYCRREDSVCDYGRKVEGAVILWLPEQFKLTYFRHPWARTYKKNQLARWEINPAFCHTFSPSFFTLKNLPQLLNLVDASIFDFLIQNGDRHHFTVFSHLSNSSIILIDNGKSFSDSMADHLDILAPLLQCCRIRKSTFDTLTLMAGGGLSYAMKRLLSTDPLAPILSDFNLKALDRRLLFIFATVAMCKDQNSEKHIILSNL